MGFLLLRRLAVIPPLLLLVAALAFGFLRLAPGGPFEADRSAASPEIERALRARYHLDEPWWAQFGRFLGGAVRGDFGPSLKHRSHSVSEIVRGGLPVSLVVGALAFGVSVGTGIPLGLAGAMRGGRGPARWAGLVAVLAVCVPAFVAGPLLTLAVAVHAGWLPVALWGSPAQLVLPVATLGLFHAGRIARLLREGLLTTLASPFIRAARARGLPESRVLLRHALPLGLQPVVALAAPLLADLLTGSFIVENLFQLPGLGSLTVNSALNRDYPLIVALVLIYAALLLVLNLAADLLQAWLDPRLRHA